MSEVDQAAVEGRPSVSAMRFVLYCLELAGHWALVAAIAGWLILGGSLALGLAHIHSGIDSHAFRLATAYLLASTVVALVVYLTTRHATAARVRRSAVEKLAIERRLYFAAVWQQPAWWLCLPPSIWSKLS